MSESTVRNSFLEAFHSGEQATRERIGAAVLGVGVVVILAGATSDLAQSRSAFAVGLAAFQVVGVLAAASVGWLRSRTDGAAVLFGVTMLFSAGAHVGYLLGEARTFSMRIDPVFLVIFMGAMIFDPLRTRVIGALGAVPALASAAVRVHDTLTVQTAMDAVADLAVFGVTVVVVEFFLRQQQRRDETVGAHVTALEAAQSVARQIAAGNLDVEVPKEGFAAEFEPMRAALFLLFSQIQRTSLEVQQAATELRATAVQQASGATEQASAIAETRATVSEVAREAAGIGASATTADEAAHQATERSAQLTTGLNGLFEHTARVDGILREVREIADRSELLSLNASLEGVRAGEAGRGFSIVADQMQMLAGRVRGAVQDLQRINAEIAAASDGARGAMVASSTATTRAREANAEIRRRTVRQEAAMGQVEASIREIAEVTQRVAAGSEQLTSAAEHLGVLVAQLDERARGVRLDAAAPRRT